MPTKKQIDDSVEEFELKNGNLANFNLKEIVVLLHNEQKNEIQDCHKKMDVLDKKIEKYNEEANINFMNGKKCIVNHDKLFQKLTDQIEHIAESLPEKGFCEKVTETLYPDVPELPLSYKVNTMWNVWKMAKWLITALLALGIGNILIELEVWKYIVG